MKVQALLYHFCFIPNTGVHSCQLCQSQFSLWGHGGGAQQPAVYCGCLLLFSSQETIASYCFVKELRNRQEWCVVTYEHNAHLRSSHTRVLCVARLQFTLGIIMMILMAYNIFYLVLDNSKSLLTYTQGQWCDSPSNLRWWRFPHLTTQT